MYRRRIAVPERLPLSNISMETWWVSFGNLWYKLLELQVLFELKLTCSVTFGNVSGAFSVSVVVRWFWFSFCGWREGPSVISAVWFILSLSFCSFNSKFMEYSSPSTNYVSKFPMSAWFMISSYVIACLYSVRFLLSISNSFFYSNFDNSFSNFTSNLETNWRWPSHSEITLMSCILRYSGNGTIKYNSLRIVKYHRHCVRFETFYCYDTAQLPLYT